MSCKLGSCESKSCKLGSFLCTSRGFIFILDSSGSIDGEEYESMTRFVWRVVELVGVCDEARFGLFVFSHGVLVYQYRFLCTISLNSSTHRGRI